MCDHKIKPLETYRQAMTWIGFYPLENGTSQSKKWICIIFGWSVFFGNVAGCVSSAVFFVKYVSIDLEESLYSVIQIFAIGGIVCFIISSYLSRKTIFNIFEQLSEFYEIYSTGYSLQRLSHVNSRSEWVWYLYSKYAIGGFVLGTLVTTTISVVLSYAVNGHFKSENVYHLYGMILLWDRNLLVGYMGEVCFHLMMGVTYMLPNGLLLLFFISLCLHHRAFYEIFRYSVGKIDRCNRKQNVKQLLCDLVRFHNSLKDWFLESTKMYSIYVIIQLISSIVSLAGTLFQLDLQIKNLSFSCVILLTIATIASSNLYLCCFFGKMSTESFENMSDCLYESNWQELPIELQKHMRIMITNAQTPLYFHGFGIAVLNLSTFCKTLRTVFTYYMMFKTITSK